MTERLRANLLAQQSAAAELERLLEDERRALEARDWVAVQALAASKQAKVLQMQNLMRDLRAQAGPRTPADVLDQAGLGTAWDTLITLAARLQRANREARARLDAHRSNATAALRLLRPGSECTTYGRDGRAGQAGFGATAQRLARA